MVYAGISTIAIAAAVFVGGQSSTIPYLLGKDRATQAYSALIAAEQTSNMIFLSIGGAIYTEIGPLVAFSINAFTYLCSQAFIARAQTFGPDEPARVPRPGHVIADVRLGFRFALQDDAMRTVACNSLIFNFFGFMTGAVFIPFLKLDFHASGTTIGLGFGIGAFCALLGTAFAGHVPRHWKFGRMMIVAYALDGLLFVPVMFTHNLTVALAFFAITNGVVVFEISQIIGWRIRVTPEEMVGRVTAAMRLVALCGTVPGALIGGWLGDHYGPRSAIIVSGIGYLLMSAIVGLSPAMRKEAR
jgi:predicted MFS family arabinose efflux permease